MLIEARWRKEKELMRTIFPHFRPFVEVPMFGFQGHLRGSRTGRFYEVVLESHEDLYPQLDPSMYLNPRIGTHWRVSRYGRSEPELCVIKDWNPALSTFASALRAAIKYLDEHDGIYA
jgi:hypothetical protein